MNKLYVANKHFQDAVLGQVTRRQIFSDLTEEKAQELLALGFISKSPATFETPIVKPETDSTLIPEQKTSKKSAPRVS